LIRTPLGRASSSVVSRMVQAWPEERASAWMAQRLQRLVKEGHRDREIIVASSHRRIVASSHRRAGAGICASS